LTPVLLGTATATYCYPEKASSFRDYLYQSSLNKYDEIKQRMSNQRWK